MYSSVPGRTARWLALAAALASMPAWADVELRVEARPVSEPIEAFVSVTDANGPVGGLGPSDFTVTIDNVQVQISDVALPPSEDPDNQKVSVVFAMDYTSSVTNDHLTAMQDAVIAFVGEMNVDEYVAIIKFNNDSGAQPVLPFTQIEGGAADDDIRDVVLASFSGDGSNILDAAEVALDQFAAHPDPMLSGPKAVILITDGIDTHSVNATEAEVIALANASSIPIFTIGVANPNNEGIELLTNLAADTGGEFVLAPTDDDIAEAYATVQLLLAGEYMLTIPPEIDDCNEHSMVVTAAGQVSAAVTFTRRDCDTTPDAFSFTSQTGLDTNVTARSNEVTITGIESPGVATVSIDVGAYSIDCGDSSTFTSADGTIANGQTICVRHTTATAFSTSKTTTLTIGGVPGTFSTTTAADSGGSGGGGGGGGATGILEFLLGLGLLLASRRRWT